MRIRSVVFYALMILCQAATFALLGAAAALAADPAQTSPEVDFFNSFLASIGGLRGASALTIVVIVTQLGIKFMRTRWSELAGKWKLLIVSGFSVVASIAGLMVAGQPFAAALLDASTMPLVQVFLHQAWKQFTEKPPA